MLGLSPEFLHAATEQSWQHPCTLQRGQCLLGWCQETKLLGTSRSLLLCSCPFLTGGPSPEAAGGSRSWGRCLCGSAQSEWRRWGTDLHRSLGKPGQELQTDWFPLHSEPVLCLEKGERFAIMPAGLMVEVIVLEQRWKLVLEMGKQVCTALQSSPGAVPLVGEHGVFTGWGQTIPNFVPGSMVAGLSLAVSLTALLSLLPSLPSVVSLLAHVWFWEWCTCWQSFKSSCLMAVLWEAALAGYLLLEGLETWDFTSAMLRIAHCCYSNTPGFPQILLSSCLGQKCFLRVLTAAQAFLQVCEENKHYH